MLRYDTVTEAKMSARFHTTDNALGQPNSNKKVDQPYRHQRRIRPAPALGFPNQSRRNAQSEPEKAGTESAVSRVLAGVPSRLTPWGNLLDLWVSRLKVEVGARTLAETDPTAGVVLEAAGGNSHTPRQPFNPIANSLTKERGSGRLVRELEMEDFL